MDIKASTTSYQFLTKNVFFNLVSEKIKKALWQEMYDLYEKNTTLNKVFIMEKLYIIKM